MLEGKVDKRGPGVSMGSDAKHFCAFFITKFTYNISVSPSGRVWEKMPMSCHLSQGHPAHLSSASSHRSPEVAPSRSPGHILSQGVKTKAAPAAATPRQA